MDMIKQEGARSFKKKIAKEDIICYKMLRLIKEDWPEDMNYLKFLCDKKTFYTLYQRFEMKAGEEYTSNKLEKTKIKRGNKEVAIVESGFHVYKDFPCIYWARRRYYWTRIAECIIPKGTEYYEGENELVEMPCYCTKKLRVNKVFTLDEMFAKANKEMPYSCKSCYKKNCNMRRNMYICIKDLVE